MTDKKPEPIVRRINLLPCEAKGEHQTAAMLIFNETVRMVVESGGDLATQFHLAERDKPEPNHADITMFVNGEPVDPVRALTEMWDRMTKSYEEHIATEALRILKGTRLTGLIDVLNDAEWRLREEVRKLFPDVHLNED